MTLRSLLPVLFLGLASCQPHPPPPLPPMPSPSPSEPAKEPRLTYENYRKIRVGMKEAEVRALLGDPDQISAYDTVSETTLILRWNRQERPGADDSRKHAAVTVYFRKGSVTSKEADLLK